MNITIIDKKENPVLSRTEIVANIIFDKATPSRKEIQKSIAKEAKGDEKLTIIKNIKTQFGDSKAVVSALIYASEDVMNKLERKNLIEKHVGHEPKKEEEEN